MTTPRQRAIYARRHRRNRSQPDVLDLDRICVVSGKVRFRSEERARRRAALFGGKVYRCLFCDSWHVASGSYASGRYGMNGS